MADRLPNETIELVLSLVYDPPGAEDVDVERERERRAMLYGAALVCRRWRPVATAMLPVSVVVRSADELAAHASAIEGGRIEGTRVHSLTVACFDMGPDDAARLHDLATAMSRLYFLRLACAAAVHDDCGRRWPGQHMVVDEFDCSDGRERTGWPDRDVYAILDASPDFVHLSASTCAGVHDDGSVPFGRDFSLRVRTLRLGAKSGRFYFCTADGLLSDPDYPDMPQLASLRLCAADLEDAAALIARKREGAGVVGRHQALQSVTVNLVGPPNASAASHDADGAVYLLERLPTACARLVCEINAWAVATASVLTDAMHRLGRTCVRRLVLDVRRCELGEAWRSSAEVIALEAACRAKGIVLEVRL